MSSGAFALCILFGCKSLDAAQCEMHGSSNRQRSTSAFCELHFSEYVRSRSWKTSRSWPSTGSSVGAFSHATASLSSASRGLRWRSPHAAAAAAAAALAAFSCSCMHVYPVDAPGMPPALHQVTVLAFLHSKLQACAVCMQKNVVSYPRHLYGFCIPPQQL